MRAHIAIHANVLNCRLVAFQSYNGTYKKVDKRQLKTFTCAYTLLFIIYPASNKHDGLLLDYQIYRSLLLSIDLAAT